ncbi:uncharacterized protein [Blastocystis hominis]|uniref:Uncharacterized protein n=1 Tax=Blastocystis hominis TaxID=12968 RepID=D8LV69_BLAHO|nr:uncharacterized protein [Blastocystis hominis]CBK19708.2 unnamed protein product [Blastocystis hominis]|eukprot:XP_012893756.1 uncharacterized protein [Blastocystis hominis]
MDHRALGFAHERLVFARGNPPRSLPRALPENRGEGRRLPRRAAAPPAGEAAQRRRVSRGNDPAAVPAAASVLVVVADARRESGAFHRPRRRFGQPRTDLPARRIRRHSLRPLRLPRGIRRVVRDVHHGGGGKEPIGAERRLGEIGPNSGIPGVDAEWVGNHGARQNEAARAVVAGLRRFQRGGVDGVVAGKSGRHEDNRGKMGGEVIAGTVRISEWREKMAGVSFTKRPF